MESSAQKHVIGIPLTSFAYADEKTQGKPSCSALIPKKGNNSHHVSHYQYFEQLYFVCQYLLGIPSTVQARRVPLFIE